MVLSIIKLIFIINDNVKSFKDTINAKKLFFLKNCFYLISTRQNKYT